MVLHYYISHLPFAIFLVNSVRDLCFPHLEYSYLSMKYLRPHSYCVDSIPKDIHPAFSYLAIYLRTIRGHKCIAWAVNQNILSLGHQQAQANSEQGKLAFPGAKCLNEGANLSSHRVILSFRFVELSWPWSSCSPIPCSLPLSPPPPPPHAENYLRDPQHN